MTSLARARAIELARSGRWQDRQFRQFLPAEESLEARLVEQYRSRDLFRLYRRLGALLEARAYR